MRKLIAVLGFLAAVSVAQGAMAEEQWCQSGKAMTAKDAAAMLENLGYKVRRMGVEHGCLEAKGFDPSGNRVEVYVDPSNGHIVQIKS